MHLVFFIRNQYTNLVVLLKNKAAKIYSISLLCLWEMLNLYLLVISKGCVELADKILYIYPFHLNHQASCLWAYDISEFILYAIALPLVAIVFYAYVLMNFADKAKKKISTCTVESPPIINSIYFRSIIKENDFNGKD